MDLNRAERLAHDLAKLHNVDKNEWTGPGIGTGMPWRFGWDGGELPIQLCGVTRFDTSTIVMNQRVIGANDEAAFKEIFVHELAHTKIDPFLDEDHGPVWKAMAYSMGCEVSVPLGAMPPGSLVAPDLELEELFGLLLREHVTI